ncbi:MAG: 5'/3'-nucleotidase SurE [Solirubrobacterales bacterium]
MKILLTNDDGIQAKGLHALRRALREVPRVEVAVIAPDTNRSASARSITTREPLWVEEFEFEDGSTGFATDGTPVDCVRFGALGLIDFEPELIVSGINHGANLGDDITYSGTVAAALEGAVLGLPAIAVSQQSTKREMDFRFGRDFDFAAVAAFTARLVGQLPQRPISAGTLLNINCPARAATELAGAAITRLGKRIYRDRLELIEDADGGRRRRFHIYGDDPSYHAEDGTDFAAIDGGAISVTPLHFELTDIEQVEEMRDWDLSSLISEDPAEPAGAPDSR